MSEQSSWVSTASTAAAATSAIAEGRQRRSCASEANAVTQSFNELSASQWTEILDLLRAL
jgi:hypothetical protein